MSNCETLINVGEEVSGTAVPKGMATDENGHIWVAVADREKGAIIEIDPETQDIISLIGQLLENKYASMKDTLADVDDGDLVDIVFAGEDLDFAYILSEKNLYKMTGDLSLHYG